MRLENPLVTVVMTVKNCEKYIEQAISSIFSQTFQNFDIIICDDGSTDKTEEIAIKMMASEDGDKHNGLVLTCGDGISRGVGYGRDCAINSCGMSRYIAIQDGDDISFPERLDTQIKVFEKNPDLFCVAGGMVRIDENGGYKTTTLNVENNEDIYRRMLVDNVNPIYDPTAMFFSRGYHELGGYEKRYKLVPDLILWRKAMRKGFKFYNIQKPIVKYREHSRSNTAMYLRQMLKEHREACAIY